MKLLKIRKALGMTQDEFGALFGRSRNWTTRFEEADSDELYDVLTGSQLATLDRLASAAKDILEARSVYGL